MIVATSSSSINVMWDAVNLDCPTVLGYRVVHDNGAQNNSMMVNAAMTEAVITGLLPFTNIAVFVAAINESGIDGPAAMMAETTLLQGNRSELLFVASIACFYGAATVVPHTDWPTSGLFTLSICVLSCTRIRGVY